VPASFSIDACDVLRLSVFSDDFLVAIGDSTEMSCLEPTILLMPEKKT